jgi:hypothetical protein
MSRPVMFLAAVALLAGATTADASTKSRTHHKRSKKAKKDSRVPTKSTKANMPRGFTWPPSRRMEAMADECKQAVDEAGIAVTPATKVGYVVTPMTLDTGVFGDVTFTAMYGHHPTFDCQLVHALAELSPTLHALGVREVKFGSAFRWSKVRVNGKTKNVLSRHGLGIALDIVSFIDEDGREAVVGRDYKRGDELLLAIEKAVNDSGQFRLLLTPRNDPKSHKDHFHLEANPDYTEAREPKPAS